jgi:hypothetical protein
MSFGERYSDEEVDRYERAFHDWEQSVRTWASGLHDSVATRSMAGAVRFNLRNAGMASAEGLIVALEAEEGLTLFADRQAANEMLGALGPPAPPKVPERRRGYDISSLARRMPTLADISRMDPTEIDWISRPGPARRNGTYGCVDFRPGREYRDAILICPSTDRPGAARFTVTASANHMEARSRRVMVQFEQVETGWADPRVLDLLPPTVVESLPKDRNSAVQGRPE